MIRLENINKYYHTDDEELHVLKDINLHIEKGEFVAIMGPSGSGKSTLIQVIGFLDTNYSGTYTFEGDIVDNKTDNQLSEIRNEKVGFVFQNFQLISNSTIYENVELPLLYNGYSPKDTKKHVLAAIERVGLKGKENKFPTQLSGGQQQRVSIARSLIQQPCFLIADEPTGALDSKTSEEIISLFHKLNEEDGLTIVMVTHDIDMTEYCSRIVHIIDGELTDDAAKEAEHEN
ncbi:MAG: ABC transporter ATP-binding protein [Anaerostipes sp.]|nr:ABC transporter ATP-binding protein [Anaerostipes sp.]